MTYNSQVRTASLLLRIGLAFVFIYAAAEAYFTPDVFLTYVPEFVQNMIPISTFLPLFGLGEIILALWLLSGWQVQYPAILAFLLMVGIVVPNIDAFAVLFRNVAIGFAALALAALSWPEKSTEPRGSI